MDIALINNNTHKWTTCCISTASDILCVNRADIYDWMKLNVNFKVYRNHTVYWDGEHIPMKPRGKRL